MTTKSVKKVKRSLSKSNYVSGLQCKKLLWFNIHNKELAEEPDEMTQRFFDIGTRIGEIATECFPGGELIDEPYNDIPACIEHTERAVKEGAPAIYEANAVANRILSKVDILKRVNGKKNTWDIYEVKMTSRVKDVHIPDIAIQKYCFENAGYKIRKVFLMHIDTSYVRQGNIDPNQMFEAEDVTDRVLENSEGIEKRIKSFLRVVDSKKSPSVKTGSHCSEPYECAYWDQCHPKEEEEYYTIHDLSRGEKVIPELEKKGIKYLKDVPDDFPLTQRQRMHVQAVKTGKPVIDKPSIKRHLDQLQYPLYFFDFETTDCAIPMFDGTRPYIQFAFQYSLHIQQKKGGKCEHREFLLKGRQDPRLALVKRMVKDLGKSGTIVAYNIGFEKGKIRDLAETFPEYREKLLALLPRFWDLIIPFRNAYAHKDFFGSASLKKVLPVMVPKLSYDDLDISEGGTASLKAQKWYSGDMTAEEWKKHHGDLLKYCKLDTLAMVKILGVLYKGVK